MALLASQLVLLHLLALAGHANGETAGLKRPSDSPVSKCPDRYTCGPHNRPPWTAENLQRLNCYCDDLCEVYDDCCDGYAPRFLPARAFQLPAEVFVCLNLGAQYELNEGDAWLDRFYVVDRCPSSYGGGDRCIREKCELGSSSTEADSFHRLPVHGRASRILYQNYFCALCNGDEDVVFWTGRVDFSEVKHLEAEGQPRLSQTSVRFWPPRGYDVRPCKSVIRQCRRDWTDDRTRERCVDRSQSNAYVYSFSAKTFIYRNIDCAACNRDGDARAGCFDVRHIAPAPSNPVRQHPPAVSEIFNVSVRDVTTIQKLNHRSGSEKTEYFRCKQHAIFDPFAKQCLPLSCAMGGTLNPTTPPPTTVKPVGCPDGHTMIQGKCVRKPRKNVTKLNRLPPFKPPKCDRWYVFDRSAKACRPLKNGYPCPKGHRLVSVGCISAKGVPDDKPLPDKEPKCDRWYTYDASANMCRSVADCKAGYRLTDEGCVRKQPERNPRCPRWFVYDPEGQNCRLAAACPFRYELTDKGCELKA